MKKKKDQKTNYFKLRTLFILINTLLIDKIRESQKQRE